MCFDKSVSSNRNCASQAWRNLSFNLHSHVVKSPLKACVVPVEVNKSDLVQSVQTGVRVGEVGDQLSTGGPVIPFANVFVLHVGLLFTAFATWVAGLKPSELNAAMDLVWGEL